MSRTRNPLQTLLRLRGIEERRERGALARAEQALVDCRAQVAERRHALDALSMAGGPMTPVQLRAVQLQGTAAYDLLVAAREAETHASTRRDDASAQVSSAVMRRKSTERLVDRRAAEARHAARQAADRALDELVVMRRPA